MVKLRYSVDADDNTTHFEFVEVEPPPEGTEANLRDPVTGKIALTLLSEDEPGTGWTDSHKPKVLQMVARALAHHNGRKNVMPTDAEEGLLY